MADKKISALTAAALPLAGSEVLPIVQSGSTVKVSSDDLTVKNIRSNASTGLLQVAGPAAASTRVVTVPDANFSAARIDAAQTFVGQQTFDSVLVNNATNGAALIQSGSTGSAVNQNITLNHSPGGGAYAYTNLQISGTDVFAAGKQLSSYAGNAVINAPLSTGKISLQIDGAEKLSVSSAGNLVVGVAGQGIDFSANTHAAGMTSELLGWYEEGAWTPTLSFGGASVGITYGTQTGKYTRIGNRVFFNLIIILTSQGSSTGGASISGLPFAAAEGVACSTLISNMSAVGTVPQSFANASAVDLYYQTTGANAQYTHGNFTNTAQLYISGCYRV